MYKVDIRPCYEEKPNQDFLIATFKFDERETALEFVDSYNANSSIKFASLRKDNFKKQLTTEIKTV